MRFVLRFAIFLVLCCAFVANLAANPLPVPNRDSGDATYCAQWAGVAIYGVGKYLRVPEAARDRALVFEHQTGEFDKAHPESPDTTVQNGEVHGLVILITDGGEGKDAWNMNEDFIRWSEDALTAGWNWTHSVVPARISVEQLSVTPQDAIIQVLHAYCMTTKDVNAPQPDGRLGLKIPAAFKTAFDDAQVAASSEGPSLKRDLCTAKAMEANDILKYRAKGRTLAQMHQDLDAAAEYGGMTDANKTELSELLEAAYAWTGNPAQFVHQVYSECIK